MSDMPRTSALPRPPALQAVLFDAGNTLVFLDHAAITEIVRELGEPLDVERVREAEPLAKRSYEALLSQGGSHEGGWDLYMRELLRHAGAEPDRLSQLVDALRAAHDEFNLWRRVPEGLTTSLARLRAANLRIGVVSNSEGKLDVLFERVGLASYFDVVVDSALEGVHKPDPELFQRALRRLRVPAQAALYAGDIPEVDVVGARHAGLFAVLVDPLSHYPSYAEAPRVASVAELVDQLL